MTESRDYLELTYRSINCFTDDGRLDVEELKSLLAIAQRDGVVDDNEKRVLADIISKVRLEEIDSELQTEIEHVKKIIGF